MFDKLPNEIKKYIFDINRQDVINNKKKKFRVGLFEGEINDRYYKYKINKMFNGRLSLFIYVHYGDYDYINYRFYPKILKDENNNDNVIYYPGLLNIPKNEDSIYIEAKQLNKNYIVY